MNTKKFFGVALCALMVCSAGEVRAEKRMNYKRLAWGIAEITVVPFACIAGCFAVGGQVGKTMTNCAATGGAFGALIGIPVGCIPAAVIFTDGIRNIANAKEDDDLTKKDKEIANLKAALVKAKRDCQQDDDLKKKEKEIAVLEASLAKLKAREASTDDNIKQN